MDYFFRGFRMKPRKCNRAFSARMGRVKTNALSFTDISSSQTPFLRKEMMLFAIQASSYKWARRQERPKNLVIL
jgi:hypothetical protein